MFLENKVKRNLEKGVPVFGLYIEIPSPVVAELAGYAGFDFIRIDCHHAPTDLETVENMIRAAEISGTTPFVRVYNNPQRILSVLDMGAMGVIVPDISTSGEARAAVKASKYGPQGERGMFSAPRAAQYGCVPPASYIDWARENIMLGIQLETAQAVKNVEAIMEVKGIDLILMGKNDLAQSLGVPGQKEHPLVLQAEEKIIRAAKSVGIPVSVNIDPFNMNVSDGIKKLLQKGIRSISFGTDTLILSISILKQIRITAKP